MLRSTLENFEQRKQRENAIFDARPHTSHVISDKLLCCLADKCAGTRKVYGDFDLRRAQRPYQTEDYCLNAPCRFRRDEFATPSLCNSCHSPLNPEQNSCNNKGRLCTGCAAAVEPCPPQLPCQDRFRRNVISSAGTWMDGYVKQQQRHELLVSGAARDLVTLKTLALWKQEFDKRNHFQPTETHCMQGE